MLKQACLATFTIQHLKQLRMKRVLITGANKGIGLELTRQLVQRGYYVYMGSRDLGKGLNAAQKLTDEGLENFEVILLDVTDQESVNAARSEISKRTAVLDILINNAGINGIVFDGDTPIMQRLQAPV
jgi:NAD(P)-dependent dehydrogenase (short-subunit alcohol dehydrogenase family)